MAVDANGNPIDPNAPSATGGSGLGDLLAGISGANISRPAIGAGIANGQALAGLRTAQTEEAMTKAMQAREQMAAKAQLEDSITQMKGPDGNPMFQPSQAHFLAQGFNSGGGNIEQMVAALKGAGQVSAQNVLGNPANLGTPAATAAGQLYEGKPAAPMQTIPEQGVPTPGVPQQPTVVSPLAQSQIAERGALANAANARATATGTQMDPELAPILGRFLDNNPSAAANMRSLTNGGGPLTIAAYMAEHGDPDASAYMARKLQGGQSQIPPNQVHPGVGTPGVAPPVPGQPTVQPLQPGQTEHNGPQNTMSNGIIPAPGVSLAEQSAVRKDVANSKGMGGQISNANTMFLHSQLFDQIADQIHAGNFAPTNEINVAWQRVFGGPAPSNLKIAAQFLGAEALRATVNSGAGTEDERALKIGSDASPDILHGAATTLRSLVGSALESRDLAALRGGADITHLLSPQTQQAYAPMLAEHRAMVKNGWQAAPAAPASIPGLPDSAAINAELARRGAQ